MSTGPIVGFAGMGRTLFLLLLLMLGLMALGSPLDAQTPNTFNVNSTADILSPANGTVTLRSAIQAANLSSAGNGNIINLTVPGTYKLTAGALAILPSAGNLTIMNASGGTVIVDGNHIDRVFRINPAIAPTAFSVTMNGFTITNGSAQNSANPDGADASGGGIRADGPVSLTLTNMT
jgi:CSLREA domain-containing protein